MTPDDLKAIRERCEKATAGPWAARHHDHGSLVDSPREHIATCTYSLNPRDEENAAFIAHAREDVPALLDEIDRLVRNESVYSSDPRDRIDELTAERDQLRAELDEANLSLQQSALYHKKVCSAVEAERDQLRGEVERMRAVYLAAVEWSESFGELSKRLPPHVHKLRDAIDAAEAKGEK